MIMVWTHRSAMTTAGSSRIVEERDASGSGAISRSQQRHLRIQRRTLFGFARAIWITPRAKVHLTDLVANHRQRQLKVETVLLDAPDELPA
jgi:hypothetical protein